MAQGNTYTTATVDLVKGYKKAATSLYKGFKAATEEYEWFSDTPDEDVEISAREILIPLDLTKAYGTASIPEAGYEAVTNTPALSEGSVTWVNLSQRFIISLQAQALDQRAKNAQIVRQVKYQSMKAMEAMARTVGRQTYGVSNGVVATTTTVATQASGTYTISAAYGQSGLTNGTYLTNLFVIGEGVALIRSSALVANAIGVVTAVNAATPSVTITWGGSVTSASGDQLVYANAVTDTTITATDFNRWPVGLIDATTSASVHGLATSSAPLWAAGYADTAGGRMSYVRLKKLRQGIYNQGGGKLDQIIWANGVENDVEAGERAARVYSSSALDLDGSVKAKGVTFRTSALVPNGYVFGLDSDAYSKFSLMDKPDEDGLVPFGAMDKSEDRSALKASLNFSYARIVRSRAKMGYLSGLTEQ